MQLRTGRGPARLALASLALALCFFDPYVTWPRAQHDMVVVLDVSQSMDVTDMQRDGLPVSRLAQARWALDHVVHELPCGSRVGWGIFSEYRTFLMLQPIEVCANQVELLTTLSRLDGRLAWMGNSEVAKALYAGLKIVKGLPSKPALVFVTDGHEAPPVNPAYRPNDDGAVRVAPGLIVGVGGDRLVPIPKHDLEGRPFGEWRADEVLQVDPRSLGRGGSVANESMAETPGATESAPMVGATPGREHLSSLREPYLKLLASETGLAYHRLDTREGLLAAVMQPSLTHPAEMRIDLRWPLALLGLAALVSVYLPRRVKRVRSTVPPPTRS